MWPYVIFASIFGMAALSGARRQNSAFVFLLVFMLLAVFIGLRHQVGPDWPAYLFMISKLEFLGRGLNIDHIGEPLYVGLLMIADWTGFGIYFANFVVACVFAFGLLSFVRTVHEPWLGFMAAMPSLVIAVSTSANRQTMAIGILLFLFSIWQRSNMVTRVGLILLAAGFHTSALVAMIFVGMTAKVPNWVKVVMTVVFVVVMFTILNSQDKIEYYNRAYGTGQTEGTQSAGALAHVAFNAIPALLYFLLPKHRQLLFPTPLLKQMAILAAAMLPLALVASTMASRLSFYWYPVSIWVLGALPLAFKLRSRPLIRLGVVAASCFAMFFWLNFANMAQYHVPYKNALFTPMRQLDL